MNYNNMDVAFRGSYGENDSFLVLLLTSLCYYRFLWACTLTRLYYYFFLLLRDPRKGVNITAMGLARRRNLVIEFYERSVEKE